MPRKLYDVNDQYAEADQNAENSNFLNQPDMDLPSQEEVELAEQNDMKNNQELDLPDMDEVVNASEVLEESRKKSEEVITNNLEKERLMINNEFGTFLSILINKAENPDDEKELQFFTKFMQKNICGYNKRDGKHVDGLLARVTKNLERNIFPTSEEINACKEAIEEFNSHCLSDKSEKEIHNNELKLLDKAGYEARSGSGNISRLLDDFLNLANKFNELKGYFPDSSTQEIENIMGLDHVVAGVVKDYHLNENDPVKFIEGQKHFVNERMQGASLATYVNEAARYFNNMHDTVPDRLRGDLDELGNAFNNFAQTFNDMVYNKEKLGMEDFNRLEKEISGLLATRARKTNLSDFTKMQVFNALIDKIDEEYNNAKSCLTGKDATINLREFENNEMYYVIHCAFDEIFEQDARIFKQFEEAENERIKAENAQSPVENVESPVENIESQIDNVELKTGTDNLENTNHNSMNKTGSSLAEWSRKTYDSIKGLMGNFNPAAMKKTNEGFTKQSEEFKQFTMRMEKLVDRYNRLGDALNNEGEQKAALEQFFKQLINAKIDAQNYLDHCKRIPRKNSSVRKQREQLTDEIVKNLEKMIDVIDKGSPDMNFKILFNETFDKQISRKQQSNFKNIPKAKSKEVKLDEQKNPTVPTGPGM